LVVVLSASRALAFDPVVFEDPTGDDKGNGSYKYPTSAEYKAGSFDIAKVEIKENGDKVDFTVTMKTQIEDPWKSKNWTPPGQGFSLQFIQVYVDTDHKAGSGHKKTLPGINVLFDDASAWDKAILMSPQPVSRVKMEVQSKAKDLAKDVIVPSAVRVKGKSLTVSVAKADLGTPAAGWGYQVISQSNEGYPDAEDVLTRDVNEVEGEHRFGGGSDWDCDPHAIDILAGQGRGKADEAQAQYDALKYTCAGSDLAKAKQAVVPMLYR
jgi:carbohydrate-binding DOMON domain-containing protein